MFAVELARGLFTTFREMLSKPVTIQYPEQKRPVRRRFKGRHVLNRYHNGLEKCIGCSLCSAACPADAIFVESQENTDEERYSPGERYASVYEINMLRCIYCGYCEDAIYEMNKYIPDSAFYDTVEIKLHKDSAGRGWHIQGYKLANQPYVDLSDMPNDSLNGKVIE